MEKFPQLRHEIIARLLESFGEMKTGRVFRGALWIVGEYAVDPSQIVETMKQIRDALGEIPLLASEQVKSNEFSAPIYLSVNLLKHLFR